MKTLIQKHESLANGYRHVESLSNQLNTMQKSRRSLKRLGFSSDNLTISAKDISRTKDRIKRVLTLLDHLSINY